MSEWQRDRERGCKAGAAGAAGGEISKGQDCISFKKSLFYVFFSE